MTTYRRAVNEEQRIERRQTLLDIAWTLFKENNFDQINVIDITKQANLAKGTFYLYFKSKEELYLAVTREQFLIWFTRLENDFAQLAANNAKNDTARITKLICQSLKDQPGLVRLLGILHVILERNLNKQTAREFKYFLLEKIQSIGLKLETCLPLLNPGQGAQVAMSVYTIILGLEQMSNPTPVIKEIIAEDPGLAPFDIQFETYCCQMLHTYFQGIARNNEQE
jgi:AcrR family transcriptional regulator